MKHHILVVDDDQSIRDLLDAYLSQSGYEVTLASNGKDGLRQSVLRRPDLILMDIRMPELDGLNALDLMTIAKLARGIPILIMSGTATGEAFDAAKKLGARDCLVKPFNMTEPTLKLEQQLRANSPEVMN